MSEAPSGARLRPMNGIHDMGGMHGFGPLEREPHEPVFHAPWEGAVVALQLAGRGAGLYNLDEFRQARERLDPVHYLTMSYYESWAKSIACLLVAKGVATQAGLEERSAYFHQHPAAAATALLPGEPKRGRRWAQPFDFERPSRAEPRFAPGEPVRARTINPRGHTRLPRYARGRKGVVDAYYGVFVYPDRNAHGGGEDPQPLYRVRFESRELWGDEAERCAVYLDCWEPYLQPA